MKGRLVWLLLLLFLVGCASKVGTGSRVFKDPFAYCAAVGTVDAPDDRYVGPSVPPSMVVAVRKELGISPQAPDRWVAQGILWRCMDGRVWVCFKGANLPCAVKADTSREPSHAMVGYCRSHPDAPVIPASVTGRATVYEWRCLKGRPQIVRQVYTPDPRGFISQFWHPLSPP